MRDSPLNRNQVRYCIKRNFSWEGFCKVNIQDALVEIGFSKTEAKRTMANKAIKIWDTRMTEDGRYFEWYKRPANEYEILEPNDVLVFGKPKIIVVEARPFSLIEKVYYKARDIKDKLQDKLEDRRIL